MYFFVVLTWLSVVTFAIVTQFPPKIDFSFLLHNQRDLTSEAWDPVALMSSLVAPEKLPSDTMGPKEVSA